MAILKSILDVDLYKLTMMNAIAQHFPWAKVRYKLILRSKIKFPEGFADKLRREVKSMEQLFLTKEEKKFLQVNCQFLNPVFLDFLEGYRYDSSEVGIIQDGENLLLTIEGFWHHTILWEVPLMAIISEMFFKETGADGHAPDIRQANNDKKLQKVYFNNMKLADFGTRRRYSYEVQDEFVAQAANYISSDDFFVGTSNVHLAHKYNVRPMGTHAHEWFMFHAVMYGFKWANHMAIKNWVKTYNGNLGIALPDTFTSNVFYKSFDTQYAKLYDGVRHDSGDPYEFADKTINHYLKLAIEPMTKTIVFSDGLDIETAVNIADYCQGKINCSFGIGTHLSNDVGVTPLNMVIKMTEAKPKGDEWLPTIKLSDSLGKHTGDKEMINIAKRILSIK